MSIRDNMDYPAIHTPQGYWEWVQIRQTMKLECVRVRGHQCYPGNDNLCKECYDEVKKGKGSRNDK